MVAIWEARQVDLESAIPIDRFAPHRYPHHRNFNSATKVRKMVHFPQLLAIAFSIGFSSHLWASPVDFMIDPAGAPARQNFEKGMGRYVLNSYLAKSGKPVEVKEDRLTLDDSDLPPDMRDAILASRKPDGTFSLLNLRHTWQGHFGQLTADMGYGEHIPDRLQEFADRTGFLGWSREIVVHSVVKDKTRVIYRSPKDWEPQISVAQTLDSTTGDLNAPVRETEVSIKRLDQSGDWDFFVYNSAGGLATTSEFPAGERPSPHFCSGCHYDSTHQTVSRIMHESHATP